MFGDIEIDLHGCARCDGDGHPGLTFKPLTRPVVEKDGTVTATHWCLCPTTGEPILLVEYTGESFPVSRYGIPDDEDAPERGPGPFTDETGAPLPPNLRSVPVLVCPACGLPAEVPGEGRFCGVCQDHEGHCANDHCMTCGADT